MGGSQIEIGGMIWHAMPPIQDKIFLENITNFDNLPKFESFTTIMIEIADHSSNKTQITRRKYNYDPIV